MFFCFSFVLIFFLILETEKQIQAKTYATWTVSLFYHLYLRSIAAIAAHICLVCEFYFGNRCVGMLSIHPKSSKTNDDYLNFLVNFEVLLICPNSLKTHVLLVTCNSNLRSCSLWSEVIDTIKGTWLKPINSYLNLYQIIYKPAHTLSSLISWIDLIYTNNSNMAIKSGVHPLLHQVYYCQIILVQISLKRISLKSYYRFFTMDCCLD